MIKILTETEPNQSKQNSSLKPNLNLVPNPDFNSIFFVGERVCIWNYENIYIYMTLSLCPVSKCLCTN